MGKTIVWSNRKKHWLFFALELGTFKMFEYMEPTYQKRYYLYYPQRRTEGLIPKGIGYKSAPQTSNSIDGGAENG